MASIQHETVLDLSAEQAWSALREVGLAHRLFAGVLTDGRLDEDVRTVTFANGMTVRERIIDVSDERRRVAYSAIEGTPMTHHNASMQIVPDGEGRCRFVWIADYLPHDFGEKMRPLIEAGTEALKVNLEGGAFRAEALARAD
ncbi:MAG TPA: SRPBCC family protein [Sphingomicrobium sp.]